MLTICSLVARAGGSEEEQVQAMADRLVIYARHCMKSRDRVSPFESAFFPKLFSSFPYFVLHVIIWVFFPWASFFLADVLFTGEAARQGMYFRGGVSAHFFFHETFEASQG